MKEESLRCPYCGNELKKIIDRVAEKIYFVCPDCGYHKTKTRKIVQH